MGKILYIRHGQASIFSDNYDQLSDIGMQQAIALGRFLKKEGVHIDRLFMGPLHRHHQTTDGILKGIEAKVELEELEGLREHQGFSALKKLMPELVQSDTQIKDLVNRPWSGRKEQIKHHMRVYENFSLRWAKGEFDHMINGDFQSWKAFESASSNAFSKIQQKTATGSTTIVVTSGGPKSIACSHALGLSLEKTIQTSWVIYNCSVSEFLTSEGRTTLSTFNNVSFLEDRALRTLV